MGGLLDGSGVEIYRGDLASEEGLGEAAAGVDAIIHAAGILKARSLEDYREVNLRGTERLLRAASRSAAGARFVLVSSQAAAGPARDGRPVSESDPALPVSWYGLSKREGEEAVARLWKGPWTILRPGVVFGPGDRGLLAYFRMAASGFVPVPAGGTRVQLIAVERAALAIAHAAQAAHGELAGRVGFLCDPQPVTVRELATRIAALSGRASRLVSVPDLVVRLLGAAETVAEALTAVPAVQRGQGAGDPGRRLALRRGPRRRGPRPPGAPPAGRGTARPLGLVSARRLGSGRRFVKFAKIRAPAEVYGGRERMTKVAPGLPARRPCGPRAASSRSATGSRTPSACVGRGSTPSSGSSSPRRIPRSPSAAAA